MKKIEKKIKVINAVHEVPADFVPLKDYHKKYYSLLYGLINKGELKHVKWLTGRSGNSKQGMFFVDKNQADIIIKKDDEKKNIRKEIQDTKKAIGDFSNVGISYSINIFGQKIDKLIDNVQAMGILVKDNWEGDCRTLNTFSDSILEFMKKTSSQISTLTRHVCIQDALLYGVIEYLELESKVFDKSKVKERIMHLNRLMTEEDWDTGFDTIE